MTHLETAVIELILCSLHAWRRKYGFGTEIGVDDTRKWISVIQEKLLNEAAYPRREALTAPGQAFAKGDRVRKVKGYKFPGVVVAAFTTLEGNWRYVVQCTAEDTAGILHIYNAGQLEEAGEEPPG